MNKKEVEQKLLKKLLVDPETGCWLWTGCTNFNKRRPNDPGYGRIEINYRKYKVHRISAWLYKGFSLESKLCICHHCDNPLCFNPEHLFVGTHADNMQDRASKGRGNHLRGEDNGSSKFTIEDIQEIDRLVDSGLSKSAVGRQYKTSASYINRIYRRDWWKHVPKEG